jgi:hypothetical protein
MTIMKQLLLAGISLAALSQPAMAQEVGAKGAVCHRNFKTKTCLIREVVAED